MRCETNVEPSHRILYFKHLERKALQKPLSRLAITLKFVVCFYSCSNHKKFTTGTDISLNLLSFPHISPWFMRFSQFIYFDYILVSPLAQDHTSLALTRQSLVAIYFRPDAVQTSQGARVISTN